MSSKLQKLQILAIIIAYIIIIAVYKDGDRRDFDNFMIRSTSLGYQVEEHFVETSDGFTISIHRIKGKAVNHINDLENDNITKEFQKGNETLFEGQEIPQMKKKNPILMGHGLGGSSDVFIRNIESKSIAFFLANQGYDVFIMNSRGNIYSNKHSKYSNEQIEYWDFSFQEMAQYDLLAVSTYILENVYQNNLATQNGAEQVKINYIGHSQGCTIILAALSENYVPSDYFEDIVLMTPAAITKHFNSAIGNLIKQYDILGTLRSMGMHEFLKMNSLNYYACRAIPYICKYSVTITTDSIDSPINYDLFYQLMYHYPAGTSTKAYMHFNQLMKSQKFQKYDYGIQKNIQIYNSTTPPEFNLSNIKNSIHIIAGTQDVATPLDDIYTLKKELVNSQNVTVAIYNEGHCSFILGRENEYLNYIPLILA